MHKILYIVVVNHRCTMADGEHHCWRPVKNVESNSSDSSLKGQTAGLNKIHGNIS